MTLVPRWWPRNGRGVTPNPQRRIFRVTDEIALLTKCLWQPFPSEKPTLLLVHGLEGCTESHYMVGLAEKAWRRGWNAVRINQRNCGGSEHLTPTLYHGGLSQDYEAIIHELSTIDRCRHIWLIGYSMGGNLALKLGGELGERIPALRGFGAVCPNLQPDECVRALQRPSNKMYHDYFLKSLKARLRRKERLFPGKWNVTRLSAINTMWEFDDMYTAPDGGFRDAADYYTQSASLRLVSRIAKPTLIITAQDDPFIPYSMFTDPVLRSNPCIQLLAPPYGGHCGFFQGYHPQEDPFWAENRLLDWIQHQLDPSRSSEAAVAPCSHH